MVRKSHARKSYRSSKRTKRRVMSKTSVRKSKKSRQVVKKKGSRKKSKKVMKGGYGRGKNHKGGGNDRRDFYITFKFEKCKETDIIKIEQIDTTYYFTNPLDKNQYEIVFRVPDTSGYSGYYLEEILRGKANIKNPMDIEDLFIEYVRYQKIHHYQACLHLQQNNPLLSVEVFL